MALTPINPSAQQKGEKNKPDFTEQDINALKKIDKNKIKLCSKICLHPRFSD